MPKKILTSSCGAATLVLSLALSAMPAYAGFQWVAPANEASPDPSVSNSYEAPPLAVAVEPEGMPPFAMPGGVDPNPLPVPESVVAPPPAAELTPAPVLPPKEEVKENTKIDLATATISVAKPSDEESSKASVVHGFATRVPLVLALRQLLPAGTTFSIDKGVDMNTSVSYKGGKPWDETLTAMLATVGLIDQRQGNVVVVSLSGAPVPVVEQKPEPLPAPPSPLPPPPVAEPAKVSTPTNILPDFFAPATPPVPAINVPPADGWSADRGTTLHKVLTEWCKRAEVELKWQAEYDYPLEASAHFNGGFEEAVRNLLAGFDSARPQPIGELHANPNASQKVLVILTRGNSYTN